MIRHELGHAQPAESLGSFADDGMSLKDIDTLDERRVAVRQPIFPVARRWIVLWRAHDPKVPRAIVSVDVEKSTTMFHRIFDIATTRRDDARRGQWGLPSARHAIPTR